MGIFGKRDFVCLGDRLFRYVGNDENVVLPKYIFEISEYAFYMCDNVKSVDIPESVVCIKEGAFDGCTSLESVIIPSDVREIGEGAFFNCTSLKSVTIGKKVKSIGECAFCNDTKLEKLIFQNENFEIKEEWFGENIEDFKAFAKLFSPEQLNVELKQNLVGEIAKILNKGSNIDSQWASKWTEYIKVEKKSLYEQIAKNNSLFDLMIREKFLDLDDINALMNLS